MHAEFWLERWQLDQIGFHQAEVNSYLRQFWRGLDIPSNAAVFVPLCGKSLDMVWLAQQGHRVMGVELSRIAVQDFFKDRQLEPQVTVKDDLERWSAGLYELWCGDFFSLRPEHLSQVAAVFDRAALIALRTEQRAAYVQHLEDLLPAAAQVLLVSLTYPQSQMKGPPFAVPEAEVRALFAGRNVDKLHDVDVLDVEENARFKARGLSAMTEQVYRIRR